MTFLFSCSWAVAACPSADMSGDCKVNYEDFALLSGHWLNAFDCNDLIEMASQWTTVGIPPDPPSTMVYIPGGEFEMGDHFEPEGYDDELPVHAVLVDAFFMSRYEVTNQQYCDYLNSAYPGQIKVVSDIVYALTDTGNSYPYCDTTTSSSSSRITWNGSSFGVVSGRESHPMVMVSWYGAVAYCNYYGYRLPTEAEWEYAARGGLNGNRYPWGNTISASLANYDYNIGDTTPVGSYPAGVNGYGLYDVAGNVWEWCNDWYDDVYYDVSPYDNPQGPASSDWRVLRGGCWTYVAVSCRVAYRYSFYGSPDFRSFYGGFRIVLDLE